MKLSKRRGRYLALSIVVAALLAPTWAGADDADLKQTIADLTSQTTDKERMDGGGSAKVEVSQTRTWLGEASNAVKEDNADRCRRLLTRVRAQLVLIDHLATLSRLQTKVTQQQAAMKQAKQQLAQTEKTLGDKRAQVKVLKMSQPGAAK